MELHSYAKTRSSRKWTIDQKRKLVENRITLDVLFNKKSFNLVESWIKLIKVSDFESFDLQFVRNQWINILSKYKNLVELHTNDNNVDINEETRDLLTSEWEFFDKIYRWIKYKEKLNHNYNIISDEIDDESINQQLELFSAESSPEDNITITSSVRQPKSLPNEPRQNINSTPNNSQNINNIMNFQSQQNTNSTISANFQNNINENSFTKLTQNQYKQKINQISNIKLLSNNNNNSSNLSSQQNQKINSNNNENNINSVYSTSQEITNSKLKVNQLQQKIVEIPVKMSGGCGSGSSLDRKSKKLHKRKSNKLKKYKNSRKYYNYKQSSRKLEKKLHTFCQIFAQIVEKDYPDINITSLLNSSDDSTSSSD